MTQITRILADFSADIDADKLPPEVVARTRALMLDLTGIAVRARHEADSTPGLLAMSEKLGWSTGKASVFGDSGQYSPAAAALINGTLAHSLDFDDTHAAGSIHPSAPIVPAALAAAEMNGASGRDVIAGVVAGYEVQIRLSLALVPKDHYDRGFHPTATCGAFGAAAAAGRVLGLSADQIANAFGLCGSMAAGSMQFLVDGAWNKRFHTGYAAMNGLIAAVAGAENYHGARDSIEGRAGFLQAYAPSPDPDRAVRDLGKHFETMAIGVKPYPSCRYTHAALDALIDMKNTGGIDYTEIDAVEVGVPRTGWNLVGDSDEAKQNPKNVVDGQFSMPFVAAVALREGRMGWDDYVPHLKNRDTLALCRRIRTIVDPLAEAEFPANMSGVARITRGNDVLEKLVVVPKGEPDNFMTDGEIRAKFDGLVGPYVHSDRSEQLAGLILGLDKATGVGDLFTLSH